jgi:hypothetical protein
MIRRNRDTKFIIYQVLYIFVVTVLAFKGAEINLGEVVDKENVVRKSVRDSLISVVDSLNELGLKFNIQLDTAVIEENKELKIKLATLSTKIASISNKAKPRQIDKSEEQIKTNEFDEVMPFSNDVVFLQYAVNSAENKSSKNVTIVDPANNKEICTILPRQKSDFLLSDQKNIILKYGSSVKQIKVEENKPPEIMIQKVTTKMDRPDIYVQDLQRTTCYKVYISDERPDQIKVNFSGPIVVNGPQKDNRGNPVYTVTLNIAGTEERFERWIDQNEHLLDTDGRYKVNFFFTAFDIRSKQKSEVGESFYFTDFSK